MIIGSRYSPAPTDAPFVPILGQSNAAGNALTSRLANTQYNYVGISTGYPTPRVAQAQYPTGVITGVKTYFKNLLAAADQSVDNGAWADLNVGVNQHMATGSVHFGPELSLGNRLYAQAGAPIWLVKYAYGGTGLTKYGSTAAPGPWNTTLRYNAMEYFLRRGVRDFRTANPTLRPRCVGILWWQRETAANNGISKTGYKYNFQALKNYVDGVIGELFPTSTARQHVWNIVKLKFSENAAETVINTALAELVAENARCYLIDQTAFPQRDALTVGEASPVAVTGADDAHSSYITQLAVGELAAANIIAAGLL